MNEVFATDPKACRSVAELRMLLGWFGPCTGRYLARYPIEWLEQVEQCSIDRGPLEAAAMKTLMRRAQERCAVVANPKLPWVETLTWLENALPLQKPAGPAFDSIVGCEADARRNPQVLPFAHYEPPATTDERIVSRPSEFARVARTLVALSPEVFLIDPYLNPQDKFRRPVLAALLQRAASGRTEKVTLWARAAEVCGGPPDASDVRLIERALDDIAMESGFHGEGRHLEMKLVEDQKSAHKMHGRYLLSIKGGIRFDQGFAQLPQGRRMDVGPIGSRLHDELLGIYLEGKHDMKVLKTVGRVGR